MEIFKLFGSILIDSSSAENSISKTEDKATSMAGKLSSGIKTAAKWGTAIVGAATAVGGAMVSAAKSVADTAGDIDDAAQRIGIDAESYQQLAYAAKLNGVEMSTMEKAAKKLVGTDLNMNDALDSIMSLGTETERTQAAIELFGEKVAYDMQPLLKAGGDSFNELKQEAVDMGAVMSNEAVSTGAEMGDMFDKVTAATETLKNSLITELMPYVMEIMQWLIDNIPRIKEVVKKVMDMIMPIIEPILKAVMALLQSVFALINGDWDGFVEGIKKVWNNLISFFKSFYTVMLQIGKNLFKSLWDGLKSVWESIRSWVSDKVSWLVDKLTFWDNGKSKIDGSHAAGLAYVPFDGYTATLHRGETVLNAQNTSGLVESIKSALENVNAGNQTIVIQSVLDGRVIGETAYQYNKNRKRAMG